MCRVPVFSVCRLYLSNATQGHCTACRATDKWALCVGCVDVGIGPKGDPVCNNWPSVASSKEILGPLNGRLPSMPSQRNPIPGPEAPQRRAYGASPRGRARDGVREHVPPRVWVLGKTLNCLVKCSKSQKTMCGRRSLYRSRADRPVGPTSRYCRQ